MPRFLRILLIIVAAIAVIAVLFEFVFPWVERTFVDDPTLGLLGPIVSLHV